MSDTDVPSPVREAWALQDATLEPVTIGLINRTYKVSRNGTPFLALQRLHPIFAPEVNHDIHAITTHLASRGMPTPRIVPSQDNQFFVSHDGCWRALTWLDGNVVTELKAAPQAHAAGQLVGQLHRALEGLEHSFQFVRAGVHETERHLKQLQHVLDTLTSHPSYDVIAPLGHAILQHARSLPPLPATRPRIIHGDLKITNLLFTPDGTRGHAVLDLDTFAYGSLAHELGDALRSWCNPAGENHTHANVDIELFRAALQGYASTAHSCVDATERSAIVAGLETIALELSARFCIDALEDRYFGWNSDRYPTRSAHNQVRARSQLSLAQSIQSQRDVLHTIVRESFP